MISYVGPFVTPFLCHCTFIGKKYLKLRLINLEQSAFCISPEREFPSPTPVP
jgi:hypothetical protein